MGERQLFKRQQTVFGWTEYEELTPAIHIYPDQFENDIEAVRQLSIYIFLQNDS